jgi:hypothetical protein
MITKIERKTLEKIKMKTLQKYIVVRFSAFIFANRKSDVIDKLLEFFLTEKHKQELEFLSEMGL